MEINEIFFSIQGEGASIGTPSLFVRFSGCNKNCWFCDSKYHTIVDPDLNEDSIFAAIKKYNVKNLILTGGEPLLQQTNIVAFLTNYALHDLKIKIEIETNGSIPLTYAFKRYIVKHKNISFNISPKLPSSHNKPYTPFLINDTSYLKVDTSFKFVYDVKDKGKEILTFINEYYFEYIDDKSLIYIMPEGATKKDQEKKMQKVIEFCCENNFIFSPRLQILIWNDKRGV